MSRFTLRLAITLQAAISAGDGLALIALANRVYQSSHASWAVAALFLAMTVPITTLPPIAGLLLDRLPTRDRPGQQLSPGGDLGRILRQPAAGGPADLHRGFGGLASGAETVATRSVLSHRAPEEVAGRVFALYSGLLFGATSLAMAAAGGLLTVLGTRTVLVVAGCGGMLAGAAGCVGMAVQQRNRRRTAQASGG